MTDEDCWSSAQSEATDLPGPLIVFALRTFAGTNVVIVVLVVFQVLGPLGARHCRILRIGAANGVVGAALHGLCSSPLANPWPQLNLRPLHRVPPRGRHQYHTACPSGFELS